MESKRKINFMFKMNCVLILIGLLIFIASIFLNDKNSCMVNPSLDDDYSSNSEVMNRNIEHTNSLLNTTNNEIDLELAAQASTFKEYKDETSSIVKVLRYFGLVKIYYQVLVGFYALLMIIINIWIYLKNKQNNEKTYNKKILLNIFSGIILIGIVESIRINGKIFKTNNIYISRTRNHCFCKTWK